MIVRGHPTRPTSLQLPAGDSCSIGMSGGGSGSWSLAVWARIGGAEVYVGTASTSTSGLLAREARAICVACCPGAVGWRIDITGADGATATIVGATSDYPIGRPGLSYCEEPTP